MEFNADGLALGKLGPTGCGEVLRNSKDHVIAMLQSRLLGVSMRNLGLGNIGTFKQALMRLRCPLVRYCLEKLGEMLMVWQIRRQSQGAFGLKCFFTEW
ncbi:hypothetical protein CXB51_009812 [Gossypium anomalum]|uniref:Uncharacterized protein n=1 Tax=Gossypium anomalum TaxID=47600 RepID=A0A8J5YZQ1_9ROSI|nr:hypothetical protein CXB51_009812 [Gossypium anomalum]